MCNLSSKMLFHFVKDIDKKKGSFGSIESIETSCNKDNCKTSSTPVSETLLGKYLYYIDYQVT